jgi:dimethylaniline monooxygenase (N-oxide forming)
MSQSKLIKPELLDHYHVIIVGAGWYGIAAAKAYLEINPSVSLNIIDADSGIGGVWSRSRIYPRLVINQPSPFFEFSDLSMKDALGIKEYSDITGENIAEYLEIYAKRSGVLERCHFNTEVQRIVREDNGQWVIHSRPTGYTNAEVGELRCDKLIMATGHTSKPKMPNGLDMTQYTGKVFHVKELGQQYQNLISDTNFKSITVVGGNKSAFELAGLFALEGKKVNWLIREDGCGPGFLLKDRPDGKKHMMEGMTARAPSFIAPTYSQPDRWITRFLYGDTNWFGRWFSRWVWKMALKRELDKFADASPNRQALKPLSNRYITFQTALNSVLDYCPTY